MASTFERVSTTSTGGQADGESSLTSDVGNNVGEAVSPVVFSADGNEIVFISSAPDITGDGSSQAVIKNLTTGVDTLETGSGDITTAASAAFTPDGSKLVIEGFSNGGQQIFEKDPTSGTTTLVSSDNTGAAGNGESSVLAVSTNGDRVAFSSSSSNLVTAQASGNSDFVKDVGTGAIVQLGDGDTGTASSDGFSFTSNLSEAVYTNEADDESGPPPEVYAENLTTGAKTLVSGAAGAASNKGGFDGVLLANGTQVAFNSESTNLVAGAPSGGVFVKNLTTNAITTVLANHVTTAGNETSGTAYELVAASPDARNLAYETFVGNQVNAADGSNHGTATTQISVTNLVSGATVDVTPSATYTFTGGPGAITDPGYESPFGPSADSQAGTINGTIYGGVVYSPDGTKIAFSKEIYTNYSYDFSATPPTQSGTLSTQVFVYDTQSGATKAVTSMATDNVGTKSGSFYSGVSFSPNSQDVVVDENTVGGTGSQTIVTNLASGTQTTVPVDSDQVFVSPTGPLVAFTSSDALVPDDTNGDSDVYVVPVCFALGTRIRTVDGDVAVESLAVGDLAVTASGDHRPIRWLGHRTVDCRNHAEREHVLPVRIAAHAFGAKRPARDLIVSPGHAICVDALGEVLIPAGLLVNGSTIQQVEVDEVTYWHVELDSHDILLAENMPAESYMDMDNRSFFAESAVVDINASPDARGVSHAEFCRPFVDRGPLLQAVKMQLEKHPVRHAASSCERGAAAA